MIKTLKKKIRKLLPRTRTSNPISKLFLPLMEKSHVLPSTMMVIMVIVSVMSLTIPSTHAFAYSTKQEKISLVLDASEVKEVSTKSAYAFPVPESIGISQHYHSLHHGIDIRARVGSSVVSVARGVIIEVTERSFGYGKHVRIAHAGTVSSLYAHLDEIRVEVGQGVEKGEEIGTIGTTGWVTGPHLHFELSEAMKTMNPREIILR